MTRCNPLLLLAAAGALGTGAAQAADTKNLHHLVADVRFSANLPGINLGLRNQSAIKTVAERKLTVTGDDPEFVVRGVVACRPGARLTKVRAVAGSVVNNNGSIFIMSNWGASPEVTTYNGQQSAQVAIPLKINVTRTYGGQAVDLSFNPARAFEKKLVAFVEGGGSAAQYLHVDEVFDMEVPINLIAWCRMDDENSGMHGQEAGGLVRRDIAASILYNGDRTIVDGVGVVAATGATGGAIAAPQPPSPTDERPVRAPAEPVPPARRIGD